MANPDRSRFAARLVRRARRVAEKKGSPRDEPSLTDSDSNARERRAAEGALSMNAQVEATLDILRGELERLFTLEEMTSMSERLLGLDPAEVGGATAKGSFARALTERCFDGDRLEALVDVILLERRDVDPRVRDINALLAREELSPGKTAGPFTIERKIGESDHAIVYQAQRDDGQCTLKILKREASRDRRAVHRFLTANRVVAGMTHDGLPRKLEAGELPDGTPWVAYEWIEGQTLAARFAKSGPSHVNELKVLLRGVLEPLAALHKQGLTHGDVKLENIVLGRAAGAGTEPRVVLIDAATDRLRPRAPAAQAGEAGLPRGSSSRRRRSRRRSRGKAPDPRSDVYAFRRDALRAARRKAGSSPTARRTWSSRT